MNKSLDLVVAEVMLRKEGEDQQVLPQVWVLHTPLVVNMIEEEGVDTVRYLSVTVVVVEIDIAGVVECKVRIVHQVDRG